MYISIFLIAAFKLKLKANFRLKIFEVEIPLFHLAVVGNCLPYFFGWRIKSAFYYNGFVVFHKLYIFRFKLFLVLLKVFCPRSERGVLSHFLKLVQVFKLGPTNDLKFSTSVRHSLIKVSC